MAIAPVHARAESSAARGWAPPASVHLDVAAAWAGPTDGFAQVHLRFAGKAGKQLDLRWHPHGPDDPTSGEEPTFDTGWIGPLFLVGVGLAVLGGGLAVGALTRNKAMREAQSRQDLDRIFRAQRALGIASYVSLGAAVPCVVLNFVVQR